MENRHALGVGYQIGYVSTESNGPFNFGSLPISYVGRYGNDWAGLLRMTVLVPLRAGDPQSKFSPRAEYESTQSYDIFTGVDRRFGPFLQWEIDAGLGPHFNYTRFQSTRYVEWSAAALGFGMSFNARRRIGLEYDWGYPELGVHVDVSDDFIDLSRGGDLSNAIQAQFLLSLGVAFGDHR